MVTETIPVIPTAAGVVGVVVVVHPHVQASVIPPLRLERPPLSPPTHRLSGYA